jgi:hypothetical protein
MKFRVLVTFVMVLTVALGGVVFAQTQMTVKGTLYQAGTPQITAIDQDHWVAVEDLRGVKIDTTTGSGPLNNMTSDNKLILFGDKSGIHFHGYMTFMDKDGDKMVWEIWDTPAAGAGKGGGKIIASTGKFAGMEGTIDTQTIGLTDFKDGGSYAIGYCVEKLTFKTPL